MVVGGRSGVDAGRGSLTGVRQTTDTTDSPVTGCGDGDDNNVDRRRSICSWCNSAADGQFTKVRQQRPHSARGSRPAYRFHIKQCKTRMNDRRPRLVVGGWVDRISSRPTAASLACAGNCTVSLRLGAERRGVDWVNLLVSRSRAKQPWHRALSAPSV